MELPTVTLFLLLTFAWHISAVRVVVYDEAMESTPDIADQLRELLSSTSAAKAICGSGEITELLQSERSEEIRTTQWGKIKAVAVDYLNGKDTLIADLKAQIQRLDKDIALKLDEEAKGMADKEKITGLITAGLTAEGGFGSLQNSIDSQCGEDFDAARRLGITSDAFDAAIEGFRSAAEVQFTGNIRAMGSLMQEVCSEILKREDDDELGLDCAELCSEFSSTIQEVSDESASAVAGMSSNELRKEKEQLTKSLSRAASQHQQCNEVKETIEEFEEHIKTLQIEIKDCHRMYRKARAELAEATHTFLDWQEKAEKQAQITTMAVEIAESAGEDAAAALEALNAVKEEDAKLRADLEALRARLKSSTKALEIVQTADEMLKELKQKASQTMLKMVLLSRQAVHEPLLQMQFPVEKDETIFPAKPMETEAAKAVRRSLISVTDYCKETAMPAFALVEEKVDLKPLCLFGTPADEIVGLDHAVVERMKKVQHVTFALQDKLGMHRVERQVADMNTPRRTEVQGWEPEGMRQIMGDYGRTEYFQNYLTNWRFGGLFQHLYRNLTTAILKTKDNLEDLETQAAALESDLKALQEKLKAATDEYETLVANKQLADQQQAIAEQCLEKMKIEVQNAGNQRAALEEAVRLAKERYDNAVKMLEETHKKGVSFLELARATRALN